MTAVITFLSDYGHDDEFVGVCHGVMARIAPEARVLDVSHGIERHDVRSGALVLRRALPYFPPGVHLAVVDPEVGGERRAVAVRAAEDDRILVGPDNGLLALAIERFGGAVEAVDVARSPHRLEPTSATFHGRDLFAPVAAHLAAGAPLADAGDPIDADELDAAAHAQRPPRETAASSPTRSPSTASATSCSTSSTPSWPARASSSATGSTINDELAHYATTFADVPPGELLLYEDAYRTLALAVNRGSAALHLGLGLDAEVRIRPGVTRARPPAAAPARARRRPTTAPARWPQEGAPHGTLVTAGEQHAGRGRQGRTWSAPPGRALLLSLVLRDPPALLPLAAGARGRRGRRRRGAVIKWPNDVLVDGRKVAGILAEGRPQRGLGGARDRASTSPCASTSCRPSCTPPPAPSA